MNYLEIIVIIASVIIVFSAITGAIYKKIKGLGGQCSSCLFKGKKLVSKYRKKYSK